MIWLYLYAISSTYLRTLCCVENDGLIDPKIGSSLLIVKVLLDRTVYWERFFAEYRAKSTLSMCRFLLQARPGAFFLEHNSEKDARLEVHPRTSSIIVCLE